MPDSQAILRSPFDFDVHKKTFINYLEVMIDPDGVIHYAVPSHQEFLIRAACERHNVTRDELNDLCPREYYFDFMTWLWMMTDIIAVWGQGQVIGTPNAKQTEALEQLVKHGLFHVEQ